MTPVQHLFGDIARSMAQPAAVGIHQFLGVVLVFRFWSDLPVLLHVLGVAAVPAWLRCHVDGRILYRSNLLSSAGTLTLRISLDSVTLIHVRILPECAQSVWSPVRPSVNIHASDVYTGRLVKIRRNRAVRLRRVRLIVAGVFTTHV